MKGTLVVAERELPALLKTRQMPFILTGIALMSALTVLLKWPSDGVADLNGSQPRAAFRSLSFAMLLAVVLVIPAFPATGLVQEVRRRTMELLLNSPLRRSEIVLGKLAAVLSFAGLLLMVTLPAMACCYAMGGLSLVSDVGTLYGLILLLCLELSVVSLLAGTWADSPEAALRFAYGATFGVVIAALIPWQFLQGFEGLPGTIADLLRQLSPVSAVLQLTASQPLNSVGLSEPVDLISRFVLLSIVVIVVGTFVCIRRISYALLDRSRSQGIITDDRSLGERSLRRIFFLVDPQRRSAGIPGFLNPVLMKEFRTRQFGRLHWLLRLVAGCAVMSLLLTLATTMGTVGWGVERIGGIIIVAQVALIAIFAPGLGGGMISAERESGGWDLLRVTPLSPGRILRGKLISILLTLLLLLCASLPGYAVMMVIKPVLREQVFQVLISLLLTAVFCVLVSATVSAFFRTTAAATTVSYGILLVIFAGTMIVWANMDAPFSHHFVQQVLSVNPMAGALNAMQVSGFETFQLIPRTWWLTGGSCVVLMIVLHLRVARLCQPD
ncbi:MAG: ABC transporter permease [Planctomycetaceae bacterium]